MPNVKDWQAGRTSQHLPRILAAFSAVHGVEIFIQKHWIKHIIHWIAFLHVAFTDKKFTDKKVLMSSLHKLSSEGKCSDHIWIYKFCTVYSVRWEIILAWQWMLFHKILTKMYGTYTFWPIGHSWRQDTALDSHDACSTEVFSPAPRSKNEFLQSPSVADLTLRPKGFAFLSKSKLLKSKLTSKTENPETSLFRITRIIN